MRREGSTLPALRISHFFLTSEGFRDMMIQVKVDVDFTCCSCGCSMGVTLQCEGKGLAQENAKAAVNLACPTCGDINQLIFEPNGDYRAVALWWGSRFMPSLN